jgi:drug/metabolite transporter, DME family
MAAIAFAVLSAFGFAWCNVLMHMGLKDARMSPFTALFLSLGGSTLALVVAVPLLVDFSSLTWNWTGAFYFVLSGIFAALIGQAANFAAIDRIGATRTASFVMADNLFATLLAFLLLSQSISLLSGLGILILMLGSTAFIKETAGRNHDQAVAEPGLGEAVPAIAPDHAAAPRAPQARVGIVLALASALCFATAGIFRQLGVSALPSAVLGAAINAVFAMAVMVIAYAILGRLKEPFTVGGRRIALLALSGAASAVGTAGFILALQYGGTVAVSTALKNTQPLFTFGLAVIFLRTHDRLSVRVGLLVAFVVLGGVLAALGSG